MQNVTFQSFPIRTGYGTNFDLEFKQFLSFSAVQQMRWPNFSLSREAEQF